MSKLKVVKSIKYPPRGAKSSRLYGLAGFKPSGRWIGKDAGKQKRGEEGGPQKLENRGEGGMRFGRMCSESLNSSDLLTRGRAGERGAEKGFERTARLNLPCLCSVLLHFRSTSDCPWGYASLRPAPFSRISALAGVMEQEWEGVLGVAFNL